MKKLCVSIVSVFLAVFIHMAVSHAGTIIVEITGIRQATGTMAISLFNSAETFPDHGKSYQSASVPVTAQKITHTFSDIPSGEYAIAVYHDTNRNNMLDKNMLGMPQEEYAFSNNASAPFGPPSFEKAKFRLDDSYSANIILK
jgi:uncharacterized protein (DUF2141 family)